MDTALVKEKKGPKGHRALVITLTILLGLLIYWLLGFVMDDIGNQAGPSLQEVQKKYQDPTLVKNKESFNHQLDKLVAKVDQQKQQQDILQTSINSYRDTMNQLLDLQKASIQKGITFSPESEKNLQQVTSLYLNYQNQFQDLNSSITKDNLARQQLQNQLNDIDRQLDKQNQKAEKEYNDLWVRHNWAMAGLQLLVLIPLLLISAYLFRRYRNSMYKPLIMASGIAVFYKIYEVMHYYFPSYIFKYILVFALIYFTAQTLISRLRMVVTPKPDWLQKQYREAYQKVQCPICQFPIKPGFTKFVTVEKGANPPLTNSNLHGINRYTCPGCGEELFTQCTHCSHIRYALLPYCDFCGAEKDNASR